MRTQCVTHSIMLLTHVWISDDRECARILEPLYSPLTEFLMQGTIPRGFINELLSRTTVKPEVFEKVNTKYLNIVIYSRNCF